MRYLDLFKDKSFAKNLRRIKRRIIGKINLLLFKAYIENKIIRESMEKSYNFPIKEIFFNWFVAICLVFLAISVTPTDDSIFYLFSKFLFFFTPFWIVMQNFVDFSVNESFLKFIFKLKKSNMSLIIFNIFFIFITPSSLLFLNALEEKVNITYYFHIYLFTYSGFVTIFILILRFLDLFEKKPFVKKLRQIKRRIIGKISPRLFKAYIKNKVIFQKIGVSISQYTN